MAGPPASLAGEPVGRSADRVSAEAQRHCSAPPSHGSVATWVAGVQGGTASQVRHVCGGLPTPRVIGQEPRSEGGPPCGAGAEAGGTGRQGVCSEEGPGALLTGPSCRRPCAGVELPGPRRGRCQCHGARLLDAGRF